ncbi:hypothetical protein [Streptomyces sp. NPDC058735]|uniref:hypothetical protein n=1 Tax=unclassified Streptomyces TaxID=2593676 RepID=UPI0036A547E5
MRLRLAESCESVLLALVRLLLPARGRHRATAPAWRTPPPPARDPLPVEPLLMDTPLVRPYLRALEVSA